jgi:hypothetical protein
MINHKGHKEGEQEVGCLRRDAEGDGRDARATPEEICNA